MRASVSSGGESFFFIRPLIGNMPDKLMTSFPHKEPEQFNELAMPIIHLQVKVSRTNNFFNFIITCGTK